jgi:apolipoprotein N-acyltransferase
MLIPVLLLSGRLSARSTFVVAVASWCLGGLNVWGFLLKVQKVPLLPVIAFTVLPGCVFGLGALLFRRWVRGGKPGAAALGSEQHNVSWVSVGLLASDLPGNMLPSQPSDAQRLMQDYAGQVQTLLQQGAQVVVAPEKIAVVQEENIKAVDDLFAQAAAASSSDVVIGVPSCTQRMAQRGARLHAGAYSCTCLREAPYVAALRIKIYRRQLANNSAETERFVGRDDLQRYGFPQAEPGVWPRRSGPATGSGMGF